VMRKCSYPPRENASALTVWIPFSNGFLHLIYFSDFSPIFDIYLVCGQGGISFSICFEIVWALSLSLKGPYFRAVSAPKHFC